MGETHIENKDELEFIPLSSEDTILECMSAYFDNSNPRLALGRGDDCAVLKNGRPLCVSSDMFLEDVHFRQAYFTAREVGHKALAVNISDLAACGARPVGFTLCLGLPAWVGMGWLMDFFEGMSHLAKKQKISLIGGDLSRSDKLYIAITVFGENIESCGFLGRGGAMPGDALFIVGRLGLARAGLMELEAHGRYAIKEWPACCQAHLCPIPQTNAGIMLAKAGFNARPPALMDISDGLIRDLPRLLVLDRVLEEHESGLGVDLSFPPDFYHPELLKYADSRGIDPSLFAIQGGEDYALLGACAADMLMPLRAAIPDFYCIGQITVSGRMLYDGHDISDEYGFDHFAIKK